ncbi:MAG TPA: replicative DNA helicase [Candidatus Eisenbacteria bacterium]|jgi:replicative DNA helicase
MTEFGTESRVIDAAGLTPPQAIQAERAVLAAMMLGNESIGRAIESIAERPFYRTAHQKIFDAIVSLYNRSEPADLITVSDELRRRGDLEAVGGTAYLAGVFEESTTSANLEAHAKIVAEKSILRQLIRATTEIQQECYAAGDDVAAIVNRSEERIFQISDKAIRKGLRPVREMLTGSFEGIQALFDRKQRITGVPSGFADLDKVTLGFQPGDLIIIAGRPAMGKSSFAVNIAENAAIKHKITVGLFSLEMSAAQLMLRLLGSQSEVALHKLRSGFLGNEDWPRLTAGGGLLRDAPIWIDDTAAPTVLELRAKCRRLKAEANLGLVVIDYLQMIQAVGRAENRVQEVSQITRALKAMAKEMEVPVIALSQLSRGVEQRGGADKRPQLSDLRDSGSIEQDSDLVMFVYREEYYKPDDPSVHGKAEIIVGKHRNGPTGTVQLTFLRDQTKFVDHAVVMPGETEIGF